MTEQAARPLELVKANIKKGTLERSIVRPFYSGNPIDYLGGGAEGQVYRVNVPVRDKTIQLAFKEYGSEGNCADALKNWMRLKRAGVPVPPTFRLVQDGKRYAGILMTDLTHGWRDILITSNPTKGYVLDCVKEATPSTVQKFAAFDLTDPAFDEGLNRQIVSIAEKAARKKIQFDRKDVLSAAFTHEGNLNLVISDMGGVQPTNSPYSYEDIYNFNLESAATIRLFINDAQRLARDMI